MKNGKSCEQVKENVGGLVPLIAVCTSRCECWCEGQCWWREHWWNWILCMERAEASSSFNESNTQVGIQGTNTDTESMCSGCCSSREGWLIWSSSSGNFGGSKYFIRLALMGILVSLFDRMLLGLQRQDLVKHLRLVCPFCNVFWRSVKRLKV